MPFSGALHHCEHGLCLLKAVNYFRKKAASPIFNKVLHVRIYTFFEPLQSDLTAIMGPGFYVVRGFKILRLNTSNTIHSLLSFLR